MEGRHEFENKTSGRKNAWLASQHQKRLHFNGGSMHVSDEAKHFSQEVDDHLRSPLASAN